MKTNDKYKVEDTEKGTKITFEKGCIVDYEYLWNGLLVDNVLKQKNVEIIYDEKIYNSSDSIKFNKKVTVEIKTIQRNPKP